MVKPREYLNGRVKIRRKRRFDMKLTNDKIYSYATNLTYFNIEQKLPVRVNFFLQKNIQTIKAMA
jgi:hypothetical protein